VERRELGGSRQALRREVMHRINGCGLEARPQSYLKPAPNSAKNAAPRDTHFP
jgi:hypothetical protein